MDKIIGEALLVAIPVLAYAANRGITALCQAVGLGKIVLITDTRTAMERGFVFPGINGFVIPAKDANGWTKAIQHVLAMNSTMQLDMSRRAFDVAEGWTHEGIMQKFLSACERHWKGEYRSEVNCSLTIGVNMYVS